MSTASTMPRDVGVDRDARALTIVWEDDHTSTYPFVLLRRECPCAACTEKRKGEGGLRMLSPGAVMPQGLDLAGLTPVGRYALQIKWSDGHSLGIYSYTFLRALCPCEACRGVIRGP